MARSWAAVLAVLAALAGAASAATVHTVRRQRAGRPRGGQERLIPFWRSLPSPVRLSNGPSNDMPRSGRLGIAAAVGWLPPPPPPPTRRCLLPARPLGPGPAWHTQVITTECSPYFSWQTLGASTASRNCFLCHLPLPLDAASPLQPNRCPSAPPLHTPRAACRHVLQPPQVGAARAHHPHHVLHQGGV